MTNRYFRVRNGLSLGTGTLNIDADDGVITTNNGTTINNGVITASAGNHATLANSTQTKGMTVTDDDVRIGNEGKLWHFNSDGTLDAPSGGAFVGDVTGQVSDISNHSTDDLTEGTTNLYYTDARADARVAVGISNLVDSAPTTLDTLNELAAALGDDPNFATSIATSLGDKLNTSDFTTTADTWLGTKDTDDLSEGTTNLYYTDARVDARFDILASGIDYPVTSVNGSTGAVTLDTDDISEGITNKYYSDTLARGAISAGTGISYNSTTGEISATYTGPATTDDLTEGTTNLYYTDTRVGNYLTTNNYATETYVGTQIANLVDSAPTTLDTLNELAAALGDDPNFATTITTALGNKLNTSDFTTTADTWLGTKTTDNLSEGTTNKYFSDTLARGAISAGTGISYNNTTGVISIGQAVATTSDVTFGSVSTATLKSNNGTTAITLADTTGDITANRYVQINGNRILNSSGTPTFYFDTSGNASVASNFTVMGNIIRAWNGSASVPAITMNASGDISVASRIASTASKTFANGSNRTTQYASITGATAEDILMNGIGTNMTPSNGLLITNADLPSGSTSGRRPTILIRGYGGQEYNGVPASTAPQPYYAVEASRGTAAEPRALNNFQPLGSFIGSSNAGSDLTSGNTPYWTAENYPAYPSFGLRSFENHRGPYGTGAAAAAFVATISGSTMTVSSWFGPGNINLGSEIKLSSGAKWATATNTYQIIAQTSGTTGQVGTYTLNASPGTYSSATSMYSCNTTLGSGFFMNLVPLGTPITATSRVTNTITPELVQFRAQATNSGTNAYEFRSWATTNYGGNGSAFRQGTDIVYLGISANNTTVGNTLQVQQKIQTNASTLQLQTNAGVGLTGNNIDYNRVYGQWQYDATVSPAAANTAYAYPIAGASGATDYSNIASVGNTSRIVPGAAGMYKIQFSVQVNNADNTSDHIAYFWWRKNGTDVPNSMGQVYITRADSTIAGWDNIISSANTTDYWELMYAVDDTQVTLPYYSATAFGPGTASMFITLVPVGI